MKKVIQSINRAEMFVFRQWGRKNYSLFRALNKLVRIAVLSVAYMSFASVEFVFSQTDSLKVDIEYDLDEVEVSAQRSPVAFSQVARIVSVIERDEIELAPVTSIQELLEYALSVDVRQRGAHGIQADISIRGGSFDQTLILLNGINITDPQTGHHSLNLPVSLKNIERIEVLEGPNARVYGPNAFSGAINIITDSGDKQRVKVDVSAGENKFSDVNVSGSVHHGNYKHLLAFSNSSSDGYIENTDFNTNNIFYQGKLDSETGELDLQIGYTGKEFGANSFYTATYPNQFEETKTTFTSLRFETGEKLHLIPSVYWRRHQDRFELFREDPPGWYSGHNYHLTDVLGSNINAWFASDFGKTAFGVEIRTENVWSNVLGNPLNEAIDIPGEDGKLFTKSYSRTNISYFLEHSAYLDRFSVSVGAMVNWISDLDFDWNIYPGVDLAYNLTDHFKIYGTVNSTLRMPTFTDLFYNGPTNVGNPDLKPEKAVSFEGGTKLNSKYFRGHLGAYYTMGKDLIDWVRESTDDLWQTTNLTEINTFGVETSADFYPTKLISKNFIIKKVSFNYSYTKLDKNENGYFSYYVLDNLKHKIDIGINHRIWKKLEAVWRVTYQDRNGTMTTGYEYVPFWLINSKVMWKSGMTEIYMQASNLFDKKYYDFTSVPQPGRWISLGMKFQLNFE